MTHPCKVSNSYNPLVDIDGILSFAVATDCKQTHPPFVGPAADRSEFGPAPAESGDQRTEIDVDRNGLRENGEWSPFLF